MLRTIDLERDNDVLVTLCLGVNCAKSISKETAALDGHFNGFHEAGKSL